jgi:hypothetical protein
VHRRFLVLALGALAAGLVLACSEPPLIREAALRTPASTPARTPELELPTRAPTRERPGPTRVPPMAPTFTPTPIRSTRDAVDRFLEHAEIRTDSSEDSSVLFKDEFLRSQGLTLSVNGTETLRTGVLLETVKFYELPPFTNDEFALPSTWDPVVVLAADTPVAWTNEITITDLSSGQDLGVVIERPGHRSKTSVTSSRSWRGFPATSIYVQTDECAGPSMCDDRQVGLATDCGDSAKQEVLFDSF